MKERSKIVIVGGGIVGCCTAYHLAKGGETDVVLVEKHDLTSGSTCQAAGMVTQFHTNLTMMRMRQYSVELYKGFYAEDGEESGWNHTGSIRMASSPDQLMSLKQAVSKARGIGLDIELLSPEETQKLYPEISLDEVAGSIHLPMDGWVDPHTVTTYMAKKAREKGVTFYTNTQVQDIELTDKGAIQAVVTSKGRIECEIMVNAAGMWAGRIAEMAGSFLPIVPVQHQHMTTIAMDDKKFSPNTPVLRDPDNLIYIREEVGGVLIGGFELNPETWHEDGVPWEHNAEPISSKWDLYTPILEGAMKRVPILQQADAQDLVNHPDGFTPDAIPCVGPSPDVPGLWAAAGMSINGFATGGGMGKELADWIINGLPNLDMTAYDVRRFGDHYKNMDYVAARCRENYKYYYYLKFPLDDYTWGRPLRTSPLYERLKQDGAVFGEKNGMERVNYFRADKQWKMETEAQREDFKWDRPDYFDQSAEEHKACRERVGLLDMSSFGKIDVTGPGAMALLQKVATNDIDRPVGSLTYTQLCDSRGGIQSDLTIARLGEAEFRLITGTSSTSFDLGWLEYNRIDDDLVEIKNISADYACICLWGPKSRVTLAKVTDADLSNEGFPYMTSQTIRVNGITVQANRVSYAGELGWEVYPAAGNSVAVWDVLLAAGEEFGIMPVGYRAIDSLRLEKGFLAWGGDISPDENPLEAGLGFAVRLEKGDFIGRDAIQKTQDEGIKKVICSVLIEKDACILYGGEAVYHNGKSVARLRSGGYGHTIGKNIGVAYLPLEVAKPGTEVEIDSFCEKIPAVVGPLCNYDSTGEKVRA
jgi:sarcosine dehydrogenase